MEKKTKLFSNKNKDILAIDVILEELSSRHHPKTEAMTQLLIETKKFLQSTTTTPNIREDRESFITDKVIKTILDKIGNALDNFKLNHYQTGPEEKDAFYYCIEAVSQRLNELSALGDKISKFYSGKETLLKTLIESSDKANIPQQSNS